MNTQIMKVNSQEMIIATFSLSRSANAVMGAVQMSKCNELVNRLRSGIVHGYFLKKDGKTIREFWGTTNASLASRKTAHELGWEPRLPLGVVPFIDCETGEWRSLRIGSFIGYAE